MIGKALTALKAKFIPPVIRNYTYDATLIKVIDGDTVDLLVDLGFDVKLVQRFRLARINCWEMHDPEPNGAAKALAGKTFTESKLQHGRDITIMTKKTDIYGRYLAEVYFTSGSKNIVQFNLSDLLLKAGLAEKYPKE